MVYKRPVLDCGGRMETLTECLRWVDRAEFAQSASPHDYGDTLASYGRSDSSHSDSSSVERATAAVAAAPIATDLSALLFKPVRFSLLLRGLPCCSLPLVAHVLLTCCPLVAHCSLRLEQVPGQLGAPPAGAAPVPRRNVYISPFMDPAEQESEVARVRQLLKQLNVPGGTIRRVMPGEREWNIDKL